jgi:hypothetical protein
MSALGQKKTCAAHKLMSALPPKATKQATLANVGYRPKADLLRFAPPIQGKVHRGQHDAVNQHHGQ